MNIAIDVDLTVVDTAKAWVQWYHKKTGHNISDLLHTVEYNINELMHMHRSPMDFWRQADLYDNLEPDVLAKYCIDKLSLAGHTIFFISHCFPEHMESKEYFIKRNFPYAAGFIATEDKHLIKADVFIDDHIKYVEKYKEQNPDSIVLLKETMFNKSSELKSHDWNEIQGIIEACVV